MPEITFAVEADGTVTVEGLSLAQWRELAGDLLDGARAVNCGRPVRGKVRLAKSRPERPALQIASIYHGSVVDGPGRRSVVQVQGCSIRCPGCYLQTLWDKRGGQRLTVADIVEKVLDPSEDRDGVTILGGEPFDQAEGLAELVSALKQRGAHVLVYTGYVYEALAQIGCPATLAVLALADVLIDGQFLRYLTDGAGEYRGSRNQRIINLQERSD